MKYRVNVTNNDGELVDSYVIGTEYEEGYDPENLDDVGECDYYLNERNQDLADMGLDIKHAVERDVEGPDHWKGE